ncbi:MAG TPA: hypothetical protein DCP90_06770 [Clostridiales bacterium]|nr:MAG: hypothetical protein A2Y22_01380 [Clostridiales bacterium GWD2_32_59]HAN10297.1 hypothetical protein [Clostridiales bacterium]
MKKIIYILALMFVLTACNNDQPVKQNANNTPNTVNTEKEASSSSAKNILTKDDYVSLKVNELGEIPVIMYHGLVDENPPTSYQRTRADFKNDLQYLYDNKYRVIPMNDFINHNIKVEAGYTPVVITFDDGEPSDFSLVENNGKLVIAPDCAVDILEKFAVKNPDFGKGATFFVNGGESQFKGAGTYKERLEYLINNGYDIGNHSYSHLEFSKLSAQKLQEEIGRLNAGIKNALPEYKVVALTYPFGIRPKTDELKKLVKDGEYDGEKYHIDIAFREGPSMPKMLTTIHKNFDSLNAPRLRGADDDKTGSDLWGYLKKYEKNPERRYISDGDASTIVIKEAEEGNVNKDSIGDKKVVTY